MFVWVWLYFSLKPASGRVSLGFHRLHHNLPDRNRIIRTNLFYIILPNDLYIPTFLDLKQYYRLRSKLSPLYIYHFHSWTFCLNPFWHCTWIRIILRCRGSQRARWPTLTSGTATPWGRGRTVVQVYVFLCIYWVSQNLLQICTASKYLRYTLADAVQICHKFWDTQ